MYSLVNGQNIFIDRRLNPRDKSLGNRQRYLSRRQNEIAEAAIRQRKLKTDVANNGDQDVTVSGSKKDDKDPKSTREPRFTHSREGGDRERVLPGNKEFVTGDKVERPKKGAGSGKGGGGTDDDEDAFTFRLTRQEFIKYFMAHLKLPDFIKLGGLTKETRSRRAGYTTTGNRLDVRRTMEHSMARRKALGRPSLTALNDAVQEVGYAREQGDRQAELVALANLDSAQRKRANIPFIDPIDVRYPRREQLPMPDKKAVMFCLMDVSASMGEKEKEMAKSFFILLQLFLETRYDHIDVVFLRHTHEAKEVDEDAFFHDRESGGTKVSPVLKLMKDIIDKRYPASAWNIYGAQVSDGDNESEDNKQCAKMMEETILPLCQYFSYLEVRPERASWDYMGAYVNPNRGPGDLWKTYEGVAKKVRNLAMKSAKSITDVWPVFQELFADNEARVPIATYANSAPHLQHG